MIQKRFFKMVAPFPLALYDNSVAPHHHQHCNLSLLNTNYCVDCVVIAHCDLSFNLPDD